MTGPVRREGGQRGVSMSDSTTVTVLAVVAGVSIVVAAGATTVACFLWHRFAPYKSPRLHNCG